MVAFLWGLPLPFLPSIHRSAWKWNSPKVEFPLYGVLGSCPTIHQQFIAICFHYARAQIEERRNTMAVPGSWTLFYDWGCDGTYSKATMTVNSNGTWTNSESSSGLWTQSAGMF